MVAFFINFIRQEHKQLVKMRPRLRLKMIITNPESWENYSSRVQE